CRVLSAPVPEDAEPAGLAIALASGNPAPYAGAVDIPSVGLRVVSASPELFLRRAGATVESGPIKGTARTAAALLPKDRAENVMIVDLVRNDLGVVAQVGSVEVPVLLGVEEHPGLVHLVSTVRASLRPDVGWRELFAATFPPGSVTGAPKSSALRIIADLEPVPRGPYCGAVGWVDADRREACLAVGIRTFWWDGGRLCFGTGAGITWRSDPQLEWEETELKAERLVALASREGDDA
ncbi:MAG: para-aminobenzoate synthetase component, partial [Actinomycetota bacterium]|nr:para-aminobenzoate synthetase component [Actinomycetota bacterium]